MSSGVTIAVFTRASLASVTPEALAGGIAERLALLTYLFCPDDEEKPEVVLARLRVVPAKASDGGFDVWNVRYRAHAQRVLRRAARFA